MKQRVSLITLGVDDLARSLEFYRALGWRESDASVAGEVAFFQAGGLVLALWDRAKLADDSAVTDGGGWGGVALAHNVASRDEVDGVMAEGAAAGATIGRAASDTFYGGYSGILIDPDGHPWEIAWNPDWPLDADGQVRLPG